MTFRNREVKRLHIFRSEESVPPAFVEQHVVPLGQILWPPVTLDWSKLSLTSSAFEVCWIRRVTGRAEFCANEDQLRMSQQWNNDNSDSKSIQFLGCLHDNRVYCSKEPFHSIDMVAAARETGVNKWSKIKFVTPLSTVSRDLFLWDWFILNGPTISGHFNLIPKP